MKDEITEIMLADSIFTEGDKNTYYISFENKEFKNILMSLNDKMMIARTYEITDQELDHIKKIIIDNNMIKWANYEEDIEEESNINSNLYIYTTNNNYIISQIKKISKKEAKVFNDLEKYIKSIVKEEKFLYEEKNSKEKLNIQE